jgi:hypothetical protein
MVDPYIGYAINQQEITVTAGGTTGQIDYTTSGSLLGARVGWQTLGFMVGGDFGYGPALTQELTASALSGFSTGSETDYTGTYMGAFIGYDFPILLRAWATYFFNITYAPESGSDVEASGTSFGVGFSGLPFVSLNAEYRMISYDSSAIDDSSEIFLSVSLPITL